LAPLREIVDRWELPRHLSCSVPIFAPTLPNLNREDIMPTLVNWNQPAHNNPMRRICLTVLFLAVAALGPAAAHAQMVEEFDNETTAAGAPTGVAGNEGRAGNPAAADAARAAELIVEQTNRFRREEGLEPLQSQPQLQSAAQYFANFMAEQNKYGHTADGQRPADRAAEHGYEYCIVLENIAYQYSSRGFATEQLSEGFMEGWKNSPGHRKNLLDADVTEIGVAISQAPDGRYYAVQKFGRPSSASIDFEIANESGVEVAYRLGERTIALPPRTIMTHQRCRPTTLVFRWSPEAEEQELPVQPERGDRLVVVRDDQGQLDVRRQQ
jgi:uncharacterized protein YkwD